MPALVQVAALAIIMIRGLDVLMIFNTLGVRGIGEFIHRSVQTWSLTPVSYTHLDVYKRQPLYSAVTWLKFLIRFLAT